MILHEQNKFIQFKHRIGQWNVSVPISNFLNFLFTVSTPIFFLFISRQRIVVFECKLTPFNCVWLWRARFGQPCANVWTELGGLWMHKRQIVPAWILLLDTQNPSPYTDIQNIFNKKFQKKKNKKVLWCHIINIQKKQLTNRLLINILCLLYFLFQRWSGDFCWLLLWPPCSFFVRQLQKIVFLCTTH